MDNSYNKTITLLLCVIIALLGMILVDGKTASAGVDSGNGYIAVPVNYASATQQLWLCKVTGENKAIMVYETKGGSKLRLVAARRINADGEILGLNLSDDKGFHPSELEKKLEQINKQEAEGR